MVITVAWHMLARFRNVLLRYGVRCRRRLSPDRGHSEVLFGPLPIRQEVCWTIISHGLLRCTSIQYIPTSSVWHLDGSCNAGGHRLLLPEGCLGHSAHVQSPG